MIAMEQFKVLTKEEVSPKNQVLFDKMKTAMGMVPNLYTVLAHSDNALDTYLKLENAPTSLSAKEVEVVNLVVSQINTCTYCLSAHTVIAGHAGFSKSDVLDIRSGNALADTKLNSLAGLAKALTEQRGHAESDLMNAFFEAGYTKENLVDLIMLIGDRTISNLLHAVTKVPVDFPLAPEIS